MLSKARFEFAEYVATGVGMALACSGYAMLGQLANLVSAPVLLLAIAIGAVLCMLVAGSIGELASMYPAAPGVRTYLKGAFGNRVSLTITFALVLMVALFAGVETHAFHIAVSTVVRGIPASVSISVSLGLVVAMNLAGIELPRKLQVFLTLLLVVLLGGVSALALALPSSGAQAASAVPASVGGASTIFTQLVLAAGGGIFLFVGFEWVTPLGRSPEAYRGRVPWSMPVALLVLLALFLLLGAARAHHPSLERGLASSAPHVYLGELALGRTGAQLMAVVSALSVLTTFNAGLMGTSRLVYALARENCLPRWAAKLSPRNGSPIGAVLGMGGICWCAAMLEEYFAVQLAASLVCAAIYCVVYASYVAACVRLRQRSPALSRPFRTLVPVAVQLGVIALLGVFGVSVLFAEASVTVLAVGLTAACLTGCALAASALSGRSANLARVRSAMANSASQGRT